MITGGVCSAYGLRTYGHLFTPRQLVALTTFSDLVGEARDRVLADARAAGLAEDGTPFAADGSARRPTPMRFQPISHSPVSKIADYEVTSAWCSGMGRLRGSDGTAGLSYAVGVCRDQSASRGWRILRTASRSQNKPIKFVGARAEKGVNLAILAAQRIHYLKKTYSYIY